MSKATETDTKTKSLPFPARVEMVFLKFCQYWLYLAEKGYHQINGSSYAELIDSCINMPLGRAILTAPQCKNPSILVRKNPNCSALCCNFQLGSQGTLSV